MNEIVGNSIMVLFALMAIASAASPWARKGATRGHSSMSR